MSRRGQPRGAAPAAGTAPVREAAAGAGETSAQTSPERVRTVAGLLLAVGVWGTVAPYVGPEVPVEAIVEVVDHVVPGILILAVALFSLYRKRFELITAGIAALAALWMFTTHVPLVAQAARDEFPWGGSLWMFVPSTLVLLLAGWATFIAWRDSA